MIQNKYFIFDLDDTLLNNNRDVSEYTLNGINKLRDNNFIIVINTARSFKATLRLINIINPDYSICNAGATIYDSNNNLIYKKTISIKDTNEIINYLKESDDVENFSIQTIDNLYTPEEEYVLKNKLAIYNDFNKSLEEESVKILIASYNQDKWKEIINKYNYQFESYFNGLWFRIANSNKYEGNLKLFEILNDNNPKDYVFGDDLGDLEMIRKAYHGVLMCNSKQVSKDYNISKYSNDEDGAIRYMLEILEKES